MLPIIFTTTYFTLYTGGLLYAVAFFWLLYLIWKYTRLTPHKEEVVFDMVFITIPVALICARLIFIIIRWDFFSKNGFVAGLALHLYPGIQQMVFLAVALVFLAFLVQRKKIDPLFLISHMSVGIFVALGLISIGGMFAGSIIGSQTTFIARIKYTGVDGLRHVTGLYIALCYFISAICAHWAVMHARRSRNMYGILVGCFIWILGFARVVEFVTIDMAAVYVNQLEKYTDIGLSMLFMLTGVGVLMYHLRLCLPFFHKR